MAFSNLKIDSLTGTKPVSLPTNTPVTVTPPSVTPVTTATTNAVVTPFVATVPPVTSTPTTMSTTTSAATKAVSGAMPLNMINTAPKVKKKQVHMYKLVLTSIVGSIAAFSFYTMYQSSYNYVFVTYQAGDTLPAVNLDIYALKRTLSDKELQQMALRYKYIPKEALLRAIAMQVPTLTSLDTKHWKTIQEDLTPLVEQATNEIKMEMKTKYILSDIHDAQISEYVKSGALDNVVINLQPVQEKAYAATEKYQLGTNTSLYDSYVLFSIAAAMGNEYANTISPSFELLLSQQDQEKSKVDIAAMLEKEGIVAPDSITLHGAADTIEPPVTQQATNSSTETAPADNTTTSSTASTATKPVAVSSSSAPAVIVTEPVVQSPTVAEPTINTDSTMNNTTSTEAQITDEANTTEVSSTSSKAVRKLNKRAIRECQSEVCSF